MDLLGIVGVFILSSTLALAGAGGAVRLVFYAMENSVARQPARRR
jgi:hypothetical protein